MSSNPETTRKLIYSILQFLQTSLDNGTVRADDKEGVEVAVQCIGEAFDVSPTDKSLAVDKPLQDIFAAHLASSSSSSASSTKPTASAGKPSASDIAEAEKLKSQGNALMSSKQYQAAIDAYTSAIALNPTNPVYFSNRAAAYSSLGNHASAAEDAERALQVDPGFAKAYSRLGHARYSMKQYSRAAEAFRKGLELDPGNANMKSGLENAQARIGEDMDADADAEPDDPRQTTASTAGAGAGAGAGGAGGFDFSRAAEMLQGMGGGRGAGAGGGMPDLSSLMNNPQIMQAAQQMMANGGLEQLMNNPMMRNLAQQFMGGQGRGGGAP